MRYKITMNNGNSFFTNNIPWRSLQDFIYEITRRDFMIGLTDANGNEVCVSTKHIVSVGEYYGG